MLDELVRRGVLHVALSGRNEDWLKSFVPIVVHLFSLPQHVSLMTQVAHRLIDIYGQKLGTSPEIDKLFVWLGSQLVEEIKFQQQLIELIGLLDLVLNSATRANTTLPPQSHTDTPET